MKRTLFCSALLLMATAKAFAQCGKTITWFSSKTEFLDSSGRTEDLKEIPTKVQTSDSQIIVTVDEGRTNTFDGNISDLKCQWQEPFKNGKTSFKSMMQDPSGDAKQVVITIQAKEGKITITVEVGGVGGKKMRLLVDSYQEKV